MKRLGLLVVMALGAASSGRPGANAQGPAGASTPEMIPYDDPAVVALLEKINGLAYWAKPDLPVRKDTNYASTSTDVEPFSGVKPYKEHFLQQIDRKSVV